MIRVYPRPVAKPTSNNIMSNGGFPFHLERALAILQMIEEPGKKTYTTADIAASAWSEDYKARRAHIKGLNDYLVRRCLIPKVGKAKKTRRRPKPTATIAFTLQEFRDALSLQTYKKATAIVAEVISLHQQARQEGMLEVAYFYSFESDTILEVPLKKNEKPVNIRQLAAPSDCKALVHIKPTSNLFMDRQTFVVRKAVDPFVVPTDCKALVPIKQTSNLFIDDETAIFDKVDAPFIGPSDCKALVNIKPTSNLFMDRQATLMPEANGPSEKQVPSPNRHFLFKMLRSTKPVGVPVDHFNHSDLEQTRTPVNAKRLKSQSLKILIVLVLALSVSVSYLLPIQHEFKETSDRRYMESLSLFKQKRKSFSRPTLHRKRRSFYTEPKRNSSHHGADPLTLVENELFSYFVTDSLYECPN